MGFESHEEVERAVIGAVLLSAKAADKVSRVLRPEHFASSWASATWDAVLKVVHSGGTPDLVTVRDALGPKKLAAVGGIHYLVRLVEDVPSAESGEDYAKIVLANYARRELASRAEALASTASTAPDIEATLATATRITDGLHFGIRPVVDELTRFGGLPRSEMSVFGGDTGAGKTLLGTQVAAHDIRQGRRVLFVSLEMTSVQLVARLMKQMTGHYSKREATEAGDLASWQEAAEAVHRTGMKIYDSSLASNPTAEEIIGWMKDEHDKLPVDRAIIDYVQKLRLANTGRLQHFEAHQQISEDLRVYAKKSGCSLVALSQINREQGGGFSLRGSKEYQNDSAFTLLVLKSSRGEDERDVKIEKNRHGKRMDWDARINQVSLCLEDSLGGFGG
jgi:replicative DNA helicase